MFFYDVHLENGELVKRFLSATTPPQIGEIFNLKIDDVFQTFEVLDVKYDTVLSYQIIVLKVKPVEQPEEHEPIPLL